MSAQEEDISHQEKHLPLWLSSVVPPAVASKLPASTLKPHDESQDYLTGVRGMLAVMSFLWVFLQTFAPATVKGSVNNSGPSYQLALRKSLSILFWNDSLIYSSIIFLSARSICLPFLLDPSKTQLASSVVRRGLRLWCPTAVALVMVYVVFTKAIGSNQYLIDFAGDTSNASMNASVYVMPSSLTNFNAIFDLFWVTHNFSYQAGNWAFPTQTLWIISALFQQSYTVYAAMVIIPYTRTSWRVSGSAIFILTAWWVYSWAWFSITGLLIADAVVNMNFRSRSSTSNALHGAAQWPFWTAGVACMLGGFAMQFVWVAVRPDLADVELGYHTGLYNTGGVYTWNDAAAPQLRADNYFIIAGFFLILETVGAVQKVFGNPIFVFVGRRSYSYFLLQSTIVYTLGIKICTNTMGADLSGYNKAAGIAFIACLSVTAAAGEVFYWLIDRPSQAFARVVFDWLRE